MISNNFQTWFLSCAFGAVRASRRIAQPLFLVAEIMLATQSSPVLADPVTPVRSSPVPAPPPASTPDAASAVPEPRLAEAQPLASTSPGARYQVPLSLLSEGIVASYSDDFRGGWGGQISLDSIAVAPWFQNENPRRAYFYSLALQPGLTGNINLTFEREHGGVIALKPPRARFSVPLSHLYYGYVLNPSPRHAHLFTFNLANLSSRRAERPVPMVSIYQYFGSFQSTKGETLENNSRKQQFVSNTLRELDDHTYEEQIVTKFESSGGGDSPDSGYLESDIRLSKHDGDELSVKISNTRYDLSGQCAMQAVYLGELKKGSKVNTRTDWFPLYNYNWQSAKPVVIPGAGTAVPATAADAAN